MSDDLAAELGRLDKAATPGRWLYDGSDVYCDRDGLSVRSRSNAELDHDDTQCLACESDTLRAALKGGS